MAISAATIDFYYLQLLARHATPSEIAGWQALDGQLSPAGIVARIGALPEAQHVIDPVVRLYQGAFGRHPDAIDPTGSHDDGDASGFWVNVNALRNGLSLEGLAEAFVASAEFQDLYGTTVLTPALITAFYNHILDRAPAAAEVAAWLATGYSTAQVLLGFTESVEFRQKSEPLAPIFKAAAAENRDPGPLPPPEPEFALDSDVFIANEGDVVTFTLRVPTQLAGQRFSYAIAGIQAEDIDVPLSGAIFVDAAGVGHLTVRILEDNLTEGFEAFNLRMAGLDLNTGINDTSTAPGGSVASATGQQVDLVGIGGPAPALFDLVA